MPMTDHGKGYGKVVMKPMYRIQIAHCEGTQTSSPATQLKIAAIFTAPEGLLKVPCRLKGTLAKQKAK